MNDDLTGVSAVGVLRLMPSRVKEIATFAKGLIQSVRNGDANALEVLVMLRALELLSKEVIEQIKENINTAADKYSEKEFEVFGALVQKADFGKYNYASSCDPEWETLDAQFKTIEQKRKDREEFLRALKEPMTAVNRETGEVYEIRPPFKNSNEGVKIFLKNSK